MPNKEEGKKGKIVIYMTSLAAIRDTYTNCNMVLEIFHNHNVVYKTKDIFLHPNYKKELKERMQLKKITVPQVRIRITFLVSDYWFALMHGITTNQCELQLISTYFVINLGRKT